MSSVSTIVNTTITPDFPLFQEMQDVLDSDSEMTDWLVERDSKCGVVLHDRLMTDAAIGAAPIKTEHSYSLHSDDSNPPSPHSKVDGEYLIP